MNAVALLLAAGESERMGTPKALLPWRGQPLLRHQLHEIQKSAVRECVVVLGSGADRLSGLCTQPLHPHWKSRAIINPRYREGKCASILAGLTALCDRPDAVLVAAVDQPLQHRVIDALLAAADREWDRGEAVTRRTILLPVFRGRRGHPALFCGSLVGELMGISEESEGLRAVVRRDGGRVLELPWDDAAVLMNLNAPVDLPPPAPRVGLRPD